MNFWSSIYRRQQGSGSARGHTEHANHTLATYSTKRLYTPSLIILQCTQHMAGRIMLCMNGRRRRKRRIACHRRVCWWAWSPILELQTREQLSHGHWPSAEVAARLSPLPNCSFMFRASTRESSNWVTASWHRVLQAERSWVSSLRADGSMPHCFKLTVSRPLYYAMLQTHTHTHTHTHTQWQTDCKWYIAVQKLVACWKSKF